MSANNAIGTGAVILTANADQLAGGLTRATGDLNKWAKDSGKIAEKVGGPAGGGLLGKAMTGGKGCWARSAGRSGR
jgi:hypothetical protein